MLTRKQFTEIARILREEKAPTSAIDKFACWLWRENPRFDINKFKEACVGGMTTLPVEHTSSPTVEELDKFIEKVEDYKLFTVEDGYCGRVFRGRSLILWIPFEPTSNGATYDRIMATMGLRKEEPFYD